MSRTADDALDEVGSGALPCGVQHDELLSQVADREPPRRPEHQRTCPHCRATLAELRVLWAPVLALAAEEVRAPASLLTAVMARVRELPRHSWHAVLTGERGSTLIAARIVAAVARLAAQEVPSVALALGGGRTATRLSEAEVAGAGGEAATDVGVSGSHVVVDVQVAVEMGTDIPAVADQLRGHVARRIAALTELTAAEINVTVVDVVTTTTAPGRRRTLG